MKKVFTLLMVSEETPGPAYSQKEITEITGKNELKIVKPEDVKNFFGSFFDHKKQEYFCALNLDSSGRVISACIITIGLLNHSLVHPRETFRDAIIDGAVSLIAVHNHPSGTPDPSPQDIAITNQLKESGSIIGINVIDHIILFKGGYTSFREKGYL